MGRGLKGGGERERDERWVRNLMNMDEEMGKKRWDGKEKKELGGIGDVMERWKGVGRWNGSKKG